MMKKERVLFTGSAGFLGQALWKAFAGDYTLRLSDIVDFEAGPHQRQLGDVSDPAFCESLVQDCDLMVIAHMFPRPNHEPYGPFNANVTGTANLVYSGHRAGVRRICLVSSPNAVNGNPPDVPHTPLLPLAGNDIYSATKACQEVVARAAHIEVGIPVSVLRIGYVVDLEQMSDKYRNELTGLAPGMIDRHDCGVACRKALEQPDLGYQVLYVYSRCDEQHFSEGLPTYQILPWTPSWSQAGPRVLSG